MKPLAFPQGWALGTLLAGAFLCALCLAWGVNDMAHLPFSGDEISASVVDTWESASMVNYFVLRLLALYGLTALVMACWPGRVHGAVRTAAASGFLLSMAAFVAVLSAHIVLTERTTALTGQMFSSGWGLW